MWLCAHAGTSPGSGAEHGFPGSQPAGPCSATGGGVSPSCHHPHPRRPAASGRVATAWGLHPQQTQCICGRMNMLTPCSRPFALWLSCLPPSAHSVDCCQSSLPFLLSIGYFTYLLVNFRLVSFPSSAWSVHMAVMCEILGLGILL